MGKSLAIDVPGGDLAGLQIFWGKFNGTAVIVKGANPLNAARGMLIQDDNLTLVFPIEFDIGLGLFYHPVKF